jgi:hypothetical protein
MQLIPTSPTAKGPEDRFTGDVYLNMLHTGQAPSRLAAASVRFTPGGEEHWHGATWLEPVTDQDYETAHTGL